MSEEVTITALTPVKGLSINNDNKLDVQLNPEHFSRDTDGLISVIGGVGNALVSYTEQLDESDNATNATINVLSPDDVSTEERIVSTISAELENGISLYHRSGTSVNYMYITGDKTSVQLHNENKTVAGTQREYIEGQSRHHATEYYTIGCGGTDSSAPTATLDMTPDFVALQISDTEAVHIYKNHVDLCGIVDISSSSGYISDVVSEINSKIEAEDVEDIVDDADVVVGVQYYAGSGIRLSDGYINAQCAKPIYIDDYGYIGLRYGTGLAVVNNTLYVSDAGGGESGGGVYTEGNGITINNNAISVAEGNGIVVTANGVAVSLYTDGVNNLSGLEFYNNKLRADYMQLATNLADNSYGLWGTGLGKIGIDISSTADVAQDATVATTTASAGLGFDSAGKLCLKLATGLHIDENGYLYIDYPTLAAAISNT